MSATFPASSAPSSSSSSSSTFRFTSDPLPPTLLSDLKGLSALSEEEQLPEVFAIAVLFLSGDSDAAEGRLSAFAEARGAQPKPLRLLLSALLFVLSGSLRRCLSAEVLLEELQRLQVKASTASAVSALWRSAFVELSGCASSALFTVNEMVDFQWRFGVTASSSSVDRVGRTFLHIQLTIDTGQGHTRVHPFTHNNHPTLPPPALLPSDCCLCVLCAALCPS